MAKVPVQTGECTSPAAWAELVRTERHSTLQHVAARDAALADLADARAEIEKLRYALAIATQPPAAGA